jgi:hypothetical protein
LSEQRPTRTRGSAFGNIHEAHVVAAFWMVLTLAYGAFVTSRWMATGEQPGLTTLTAAGAVTSVWLYLPIRYRRSFGSVSIRWLFVARVALMIALASVAAGEWFVAGRSLVQSARLHVVPAISAFAFTFVLRHLLLDFLRTSPGP